jgi:hypothetical protein
MLRFSPLFASNQRRFSPCQVNKFKKSGTVVDVAASPDWYFVITKTGRVNCSQNGIHWTQNNSDKIPPIRKIAAAEKALLGVTDNKILVVMCPSQDKTTSAVRLDTHLGQLANVDHLDAAGVFGCVFTPATDA